MVKIHDLTNYEIKESDVFFFDANIWMFMFCSVGKYGEDIIEGYSNFYQNIIEKGNTILTNSLLLSEFINSYSRLEFNIHRKKDNLKDFKKDFRTIDKYNSIFQNINLITEKKILKNTTKLSDSFENFDETIFFSNKNNFDFNDEYYAHLAQEHNFKIVTHDRDLTTTSQDIEIITKLII